MSENCNTITYRLTDNKRVAKFTALLKDATNSTATRFFAKIPPSATPWLTAIAGVTLQHYLEPNQFYPQDTDPTTITGSAPGGGYTLGGTAAGLDRGITVAVKGTRVRCIAAGAINAGDKVCVADQYGRVNNYTNLSIAGGTKLFSLGTAVSKSSEANDVIFIDLDPQADAA